MHRIDSDGATLANQFTEGNPNLAIPATVVSAAIMNALQEELCSVIEGYGLTLLTSGTDTWGQLKSALEKIHLLGGRSTSISQAIANNQASAADVASFPTFDKTVTKSIEFFFTVQRRTDTNNAKESGRGYITYDSETNVWDVAILSGHDNAGITFSVVSVSGNIYKLQYTSDNMAGSSYAGTMKITDIKEIR